MNGGFRMRDILFRGKRVDNGEWVEGYYAKSNLVESNPIIQTDFDDYEVFEKSVGQFTGTYDKNNVRIFEGDIVKISNFIVTRLDKKEYSFNPFNLEVVYKDGCFFFSTKEDAKNFYGLYLPDAVNPLRDNDSFSFLVIGNIYDSGNLIESGTPLMDRILRNIGGELKS